MDSKEAEFLTTHQSSAEEYCYEAGALSSDGPRRVPIAS